MPPKATKAKKRPGRPLKQFPGTTEHSTFDPPTDLDTLANAAESEGLNFDKMWPKLDVARQRLVHLRTLKTARGLSKEKGKELESAVNAYHAVLLNPMSILETTPDLYKDEFKFQAILVARDYLLFCIDVTPKKDDLVKVQFLAMLEEKLIQPIREQPNLWGKWFTQLTDAAKQWGRLRDTTVAAIAKQALPPSPSSLSEEPANSEPSRQTAPHYQSVPQPGEFQSQYYQTQSDGYSYDLTSKDPYRNIAPPGYGSRYAPTPYYPPIDPRPVVFSERDEFPPPLSNYAATNLHSQPREQRPSAMPPTNQPIEPGPPMPPTNLPFEPRQSMYPMNQPPVHTPSPPTMQPEMRRPTPMRTERQPTPPPALRQTLTPPIIRKGIEHRLHKVNHAVDLKANFDPAFSHIHRHPSYSISGDDEEQDDDSPPLKSQSDQPEKQFLIPSPHKRPKSASMDNVPDSKRIKLGNSRHPPTAPDSDSVIIIDRPKTREEMYKEVAQQHAEDVRQMSTIPEGPNTLDSEPTFDRIPVVPLRKAGTPFPHRPPTRSRSRADIDLHERLTPSFETMTTRREGSPNRENWKFTPTRPIPRRPGLAGVLPPGWNALGVKSPENYAEGYPESTGVVQPSLLVANFNHVEMENVEATPPARSFDMPLSTQISAMMVHHDQHNKQLPPTQRQYYIHKRSERIANGSNRSKVYNDGLIKLGRFFLLTEEEVSEVQRYLRFISGRGDTGAKTMLRLVCRSRTAGQSRNSNLWPENTIVMVNGKAVRITPDIPCYLAKEELASINNVRVKVHPSSIHSPFAVTLEVFSLLSFDELKRWLKITSPKPKVALDRYLALDIFHAEDHKAQIPLRCCGQCPHMTFPVFGKNCTHVQRLELSCFVQYVSVGPLFEWICPLCNTHCGDETPVTADTLLMGILKALPAGHKKENVQISSQGQICDDESDPDDDGDEPTDSDNEDAKFE